MPVFVIVDKGTPGIPPVQALWRLSRSLRQTRGYGNIFERAIAQIAIQDAVTPVSDKKIGKSIVVEIAHTAALPPTGFCKAGLQGDVRECSVAIVLVQAANRRIGGCPVRLEPCAVDEKDVEPSVIIEVEERYSASRSFQQKAISSFAAENRPGTKPGLFGDVSELNAPSGSGRKLFQREYARRGAQGSDEASPGKWHNVGVRAYSLAALSAIVLYAAESSGPIVHDLEGRPVHPLASDIAVLVFTRTDCPISNRYAPELLRLHARFKTARFWLVYADPEERTADIRTHLREYGYPFDALRDVRHRLVRFTGVKNTPEVAVYARGRPVYRGRIDDRHPQLGKSRPRPTAHDLEDALTAATAGGHVRFRSTSAVGCIIEGLR